MRVLLDRVLLTLAATLLLLSIPANAQQLPRADVRTVTVVRNGVKKTQPVSARIILSHPGAVTSPRSLVPTAVKTARIKTLTVNPSRSAAPAVVHPRDSGPAGNATAYDFGNVNVAGAASTITFTYTPPDTSSSISLSLFAGLSFSIQSGTCNSSQCLVTVAFSPLFPGRITDALTLSDSSGNVLYKTFLTGTGVAGLFSYELGQGYGYQNFVKTPAGIVVGPDEFYYLIDNDSASVRKFSRDFSTSTTLPFTGLTQPSGIAVDGNGTVYVADQVSDTVSALTTMGVQTTVGTSALAQPTGLAVDGTGALFIADTGNNRVIKIDNQGTETTVATGLDAPQGIALDFNGNLYIADGGNGGQIILSPAANSSATLTFNQNLGSVQGVAVDASLAVYYTTPSGLGVINSSYQNSVFYCGNETCDGGGPDGIALDENANVILTYPQTSYFFLNDRSGGNFILSTVPGQTAQGTLGIGNAGNAPLTFSNQVVSGPTFTFDSSSTCANSSVLQVQQGCAVTVDFTPPAAQNYSETYTPTTNSLNTSATTDPFTLYGQGQSIPSQITLSIDNTTPAAGQTVTFTGTVSAGTYTTEPGPTGSISFYDGGTLLGTVNISTVTGNSASYSTSSLAGGSHSITAQYNGDSIYAISTSASQTVTVGGAALAPTTTQLRVSSSSITAGTSDLLTATVTASGNGIPGSVTFADQNGTIGTATLNVGDGTSTASYNATSLSVGSHQITATYTGTSTYAASSSAVQTITVTAASGSGKPVTVTLPAGSTVAAGTEILLYPRVSDASTGFALTAGQVILCDAAVADCRPEISLGTLQLINNSDRRSYLALTPSIGTHTYKAVFLATSAYQSGSSSVATYTVTGIHSDTTTITATGNPGAYTLTGTVVGVGSPTLAPTGALTFHDTTAGSVLGSAALGSGTLGFTTVQPAGSPVAVGAAPYGVAAADFNGDGFADIVTENYSGGTISVLLGHGDGTFQPAVSYSVGSLPERVLVADVNADGYPDILVANTGSGTISVLLNNGDGTFQTQVTYAAASPVGLGVEDLNHDGFPDIVAGDYYSNTFSVLLNNGDGTFAAAVTYPTGGTPQTLAEGDFNGDGNVDIAVGNLAGNNVGIYLGKGDGTFSAAVTYPVGRAPQGVSVGDFNADGKEDLAVVNSTDNSVSILLGNGDGSFQTQVTYPVGADPVGIVVADFNGDGKQDISVGNTAQSALTQSLLLGNGDGTFQSQLTYKTGNFPYGEAVADFDGDGFPDLAIADFSDSTVTVLLSRVTQTAAASLSGVAVSGASGTHSATASYAGDTNFAASTSTSTPLTPATLTTSTTTLTIIPTTQAAGSPVNLSVAVTSTQSTATPTGTVTFTNVGASPAVVLGSVTLSSAGTGVFGSYFSQAGIYSIVATYSGDTNFAASASAPQTLTITPISSATTLSVSAPAIAAGQTETLTAFITGGGTPVETGTVTFADQNGTLGTVNVTATTTGSTGSLALTTLTTGTHLITATYNGDTNHLPSTSATQTVTVAAAAPGVSPTVTTLTAASPTVAYKSPASLTAAVTAPATGAAITTGQVLLCTSAAIKCSPELALATAQLTSTGTATFHLAPGAIGAHAYEAVFLATATGTTSTSPTATVTVTGTFADTTTLTASGAPGAYNLTATTVGLSSPTLAPAGLITFNDTTTSTSVGTATLGTPAATLAFAQATGSPYTAGINPLAAATGDFNGDGFADVVITNERGNSITVLLGNGDGTFKTPVNYAVGSYPESVKVADVNGDGFADLLVGNGNSGTLGVLLGNGDGTFKAQVTSSMGLTVVSFGVADVNGDGIPDVVAASLGSDNLEILLGNGDGTFKSGATYSNGHVPAALSVGDFNGDGKPDLAVIYQDTNSIGVYLGIGDGTFQSPVSYPVGTLPVAISIGDFNGDGVDDLAIANHTGTDGTAASTVSILLGNGDGTFKAQVTYAAPYADNILVADFNGDGKQDLGVTKLDAPDAQYGQSILLGNGDGTFQPPSTFATPVSYASVAADFNGDGLPDLALSLYGANGAGIYLTQLTQTTTATLNNVSIGAPAGSHQVTASYPGNSSFAASTSSAIPLINAGKTTSTTALTVSPSSQTAGQPVTFNALVTAPAGFATIPTGTVTFTYTGTAAGTLGTANLAQGTTTFTASSLVPGTYNILATYSGDPVFLASASPVAFLTITAIPTTTAVQAAPTTLAFGATETLTATITGGAVPAQTGSITFFDGSSTLSIVTVTATTTGSVASLTIKTLAVGPHVITARYSGDANYATSTSPAQTVTVTNSATTITLTPSAPSLAAIQPETLTATILGGTAPSETGTVTFADQTGSLGTANVVPTATGSIATLTLPTLSVLTHQITARYSGDANYAAATSAAVPVVVSLATQTITFPPIPSHNVGDPTFTLAATASSSLPITYSLVSGPATLSGASVTVTGVGSVIIQAAQPGNAQYAAATSVSQTFAVAYLIPTLTSITPNSGVVGNGNTTIALLGTNFAATDQVLLNGTVIASTYTSPTTLSAVVPASFFSAVATGLITVHDTASSLTTASVNFVVTTGPGITFTGPSTAGSGQQPTLSFTLANPYPVALSGTISLTFTSGTSTLIDDPNVVFSNGTRTISYTIPANSTVTPTVQLQTGTVSGTATITLSVAAGGVNINLPSVAPVVITIPPAAPSITSTLPLVRSGNNLTASFIGYSNTREAVQAIFHFTAVPGGNLATPDVTVNVAQDFATFYNSAASDQYGSSFTFTQPFTLSQDASVIQSVTVTLINSIGTSSQVILQ